MRPDEAEATIRRLCHRWRHAAGHDGTPSKALRSEDFVAWLRTNHPECFDFRSVSGVEGDIEGWFDSEFEQSWAS